MTEQHTIELEATVDNYFWFRLLYGFTVVWSKVEKQNGVW